MAAKFLVQKFPENDFSGGELLGSWEFDCVSKKM